MNGIGKSPIITNTSCRVGSAERRLTIARTEDRLVTTEANEAEGCRLLSRWTQKAEELLFIRLSHAFLTSTMFLWY